MSKKKHYNLKPGFKTVGSWGWNDENLWSKISKGLPDDCWYWTGSMSPSGALMGAYKNDHQQMTQARRLTWMSVNNEDVSPYQVNLSCTNQACCNPLHFQIKKNNRTPMQ